VAVQERTFKPELTSVDSRLPAPSEVRTSFIRAGFSDAARASVAAYVLLDSISVHSLNQTLAASGTRQPAPSRVQI
jgi:hypothetical protein